MGGISQETAGALSALPGVIRAFREGGGVGQADDGPDFWEGLERLAGAGFDHLLVPEWMEAMPVGRP
jgi:hypothetical protein